MTIGLVVAGSLTALSAQPTFAQCKSGQSTFSFADAEHWFTGAGQCYVASGGMTSIQISALGAAGAKAPFGHGFDTRTTTLTKSASVAPPNTPAGAQLRWLLAALGHLPIPDAAVRTHFDPAVIDHARVLNQVLEGFSGARLVSIAVSQPRTLVSIVSLASGQPQSTVALRVKVTLSVDSQGLIRQVLVNIVLPAPPKSWGAVDRDLRSVAPQVRMLVANVTGGYCRAVPSIHPATAAPLGSAFKLYVLDALGRAIASGKTSWKHRLTVTAKLKSLPSGELWTEPNGTKVSVHDTAAKMISISDNTAADMLINFLGRPAVEAVLATTRMAHPARDKPFLTAREWFTLKLHHWPTLAKRYAAASRAGRRALLAHTVDSLPLPGLAALTGWTKPRDIDSLEWFASANDICGAYTSLAALARRPGLSPIATALELNDGGLGLDPAHWKATWYKGGEEPGVLTLTYLATTRSGHRYVVAVLAENPSTSIQETTAAAVLLSAIKGAFTLAARY